MNRTSQHQRPAADEWNKLVALPHPKSPKPPKPTPENKQPRTYTFSRVWKYISRTAAVIAISVIFILALVYVWPNLIAQEPASSGNHARLPSDSPTNQPTTRPPDTPAPFRYPTEVPAIINPTAAPTTATRSPPIPTPPRVLWKTVLHRGVRIVRKQIPRRGASQSPERCTKHHRRRLENPRRTESDRRGKMSRSNNRGPSTVPTRN